MLRRDFRLSVRSSLVSLTTNFFLQITAYLVDDWLDVRQQRMLPQFTGKWSMLQIFYQTFCYEVRQVRRVYVGILQRRWWISRNLEESSHRVKLREGRITLGQFNRRYSNRPDIATGIVRRIQLLLTSYNLNIAISVEFRCMYSSKLNMKEFSVVSGYQTDAPKNHVSRTNYWKFHLGALQSSHRNRKDHQDYLIPIQSNSKRLISGITYDEFHREPSENLMIPCPSKDLRSGSNPRTIRRSFVSPSY